jgi:hypothetical protein
LSASWTVVAGDILRVQVNGQCSANGQDRHTTVRLKEDGTTIRTMTIGAPVSNLSYTFNGEKTRSGLSSGSHTYTVTGQIDAFTGAINETELSISRAN